MGIEFLYRAHSKVQHISSVLLKEMKPLPVFRCYTAWLMARLGNITHSFMMNRGPVKTLSVDSKLSLSVTAV